MNNKGKEIKLNNIFVYILFAAIVVVSAIMSSNFFTLNNFLVICRQTATTAMIAFGMCFVITADQIDLSIGGVVCLTGMLATYAMEQGINMWLASLIGISVGVVFGLMNGLLIAKLELPAFLVTLGTSSITSGIAMTMTNQKPVTIYDTNFTAFWGKATIAGIPVIVLWALGFFVFYQALYKFTPFGNHVKAFGGNLIAARFSGIKTDRVVTKVMLISGICSSFCGLMLCSRFNQGRPDIGGDLALDAITAVALGGTPFTGGSGSMIGSLFGAFVLITLTNALVILGVPTTAQTIVKGVIVIIAVIISTRDVSFRFGKKEEKKAEKKVA